MNKRKNVPKDKPHILLLLTKWWGGDPNLPPPDIDQQLSLLEVTGLATIAKLYYDEYKLNYDRPVDSILLNLCFEIEPDLIVIALFPGDFPGGRYTPQIKTLDLIKNYLGIPIVAVMTDSVNHRLMEPSELVAPFVNLIVLLDSSTAYLEMTSQPEKYLPMWSLRDPRIFYDAGIERDIGVSFIGSVANYPDRIRGISILRQNNIEVYQTGGAQKAKLPIDEYAHLMRRSKISLNFSRVEQGESFQLKGRVIEVTMCGSMLLEAENPETAKWFEPMVDYVPFSDEKDMIEKARYYLEHEIERREIAGRGYNKVKEKYSGEKFWKTIFDKIGLEKNSERGTVTDCNDYEKSKIDNDNNSRNLTHRLMKQIIYLDVKLQEARGTIEQMENSKFWKLRNAWVRWKKNVAR